MTTPNIRSTAERVTILLGTTFLHKKGLKWYPILEPDSLIHVSIDGFHSDVIKLLSQNSEVLWILINTRLKTNKKKIFAQVSIPVACFISKIQKLPSFQSAWHQNRNAVSLKKVSRLDFQQYSWLSFNGHLYKTVYKLDISLRRTLSAGPKGGRLTESWLYNHFKY